MSSVKRRYNSIDLFKFIMAFAVIALHTEPLRDNPCASAVKIYSILVSMAVPFFFLASGYLLASGTDSSDDICDPARIKRQTIKILKMYLLWNLIYFPITVAYFLIYETSPIRCVFIFIRGLVLVGEQYNSWPLWYLLSIVYSLVFLSFFVKRFRKPGHFLALSAIASIFCVGLTALVKYEGTYGGIGETLRQLVYLGLGNGRIFSGLVYIPVGMLMVRKKLPVYLNAGMLVAAGVIQFFTDNLIVTGYLTIIASIGLFGLVESLRLKDSPVYAVLRSMSTSMYLIHMYIWTGYYMLVYREKTFGPDSFIVTSAVAVLVSLLYCMIVNYGKRKSAAEP